MTIPVESVEGLEEIVRRWIEETPIRVLRLEPGDALVVQAKRLISVEQAEHIERTIRARIPDVPVLIFPPDLELSHVVRTEPLLARSRRRDGFLPFSDDPPVVREPLE